MHPAFEDEVCGAGLPRPRWGLKRKGEGAVRFRKSEALRAKQQ